MNVCRSPKEEGLLNFSSSNGCSMNSQLKGLG